MNDTSALEAPTPPSWVNLLTLMVHGADPEPTVHGILRSVPGRDPGYRWVGWAGTDGPPVFTGARPRAEHDEYLPPGGEPAEEVQPDPPLRVWRDGRRLRLEELDGSPTLIVGDQHCWQFEAGRDIPLRFPARRVSYQLSGTELLTRRPAHEFAGDDFTRPTGPVGATTFLNRPAWTVELAPPPQQPHPKQLVVDATTGLLLQQRNDGLGSRSEWTELTLGLELPEDLFIWTGPYLAPDDNQARLAAEHAEDGRRRTAWFTHNVAALPLRIELTVGVWVHEYDEATGALQASFGEHHLGMIARRPVTATDDWDLRWNEPGRRWSDDRWQWAPSVHHDDITDESFAALREHLSAGPGNPQ